MTVYGLGYNLASFPGFLGTRLILIHFCITYTHTTYLLRTTVRITEHAMTINTIAITLPVIAPASAEVLETMYEKEDIKKLYRIQDQNLAASTALKK